ncbi:unnamed protein product [Didymodactylos carnosus]|uniref:Cilia- and flagella-associated protein 91 n=1 Tax=Didymodactylos carnosus TaxID=1234261 RepID=A0A813TQ61_9BILA|nr:unnamed protein product [Didymodactylos carnosus]CAF0822876.1 unnamed protein product [Didymodactylos carnosus]CAF3600463.1 unnamed protein product [Didymodactylos carnosus]CAF3607209.1 unnamed protein product [Didymodactylos carnosus]
MIRDQPLTQYYLWQFTPLCNTYKKSVIKKKFLKPATNKEGIIIKTIAEFIRHIGTQTDYRDESSQTDPYSPAYTITDEGKHPEIFSLADLSHGKGLPATSLEISFIERLRAKRDWEKDYNDPEMEIKRTRIVIEREMREWKIRETKIKTIQEAKLKIFMVNLRTYVESDNKVTDSKLKLCLWRKERQLHLTCTRLNLNMLRDLRRLKRMYRLRDEQINNVTKYDDLGVIGSSVSGAGCFVQLKPPFRSRPKDSVAAYTNYASETYAPYTRHGYFPDRRAHRFKVDTSALNKHENLVRFEETLPKHALIPKIEPPRSMMTIHDRFMKKNYKRMKDLDRAYQLIQEEKAKYLSIQEPKPFRFVEKIETVDEFKNVRTMPARTEEFDRRRAAIIHLQSFLRGKTTEAKIMNVHQMRYNLLKELKSGSQFDQTEEETKTTTECLFKLKWNIPPMSIEDQALEYFESETISNIFDFLNKELIRLQSEQAIHALIMLADRRRREHEAAESGSRAKANERRMIEDRTFQEVVI